MNRLDNFINQATKVLKKQAEISENDIEKHFVDYCETKGCLALKLVVLRKKGFPDRTVLTRDGDVFFIEFKKKGEKLKPIQSLVKRSLVTLNFTYYMCDEIGQAEQRLDAFILDNTPEEY